MKIIIVLWLSSILITSAVFSQNFAIKDTPKRETNTENALDKGIYYSELEMLNIIQAVNSNLSVDQLALIMRTSMTQFPTSKSISIELTHWLKENHAIYTSKSAIEVHQL